MSSATTAARRGARILRSTPAILVFYAIAICGLGVSWQANTKATAESEARTQAVQAQSLTLRESFCGILESVAFPPAGVPGPLTEYGKNQQVQFKAGAARLGCTIDPTDGR